VSAKPVPGKDLPTITGPDGTPITLGNGQSLPPGSKVDVSGNAAIDLADATGQEMVFFGQTDGVPSTFVFQGVKGGYVQLSLAGGTTSSRKLSSVGSAAKAKKPIRRLWGTGKGKFTTKGKYASATVRGTQWLIADYADHTLVTVKRGLVAVQNLVTKKTTLVPAGKSIIVNKAPPKKPNKPAKPKTKKK
jgi:hypothetical protein